MKHYLYAAGAVLCWASLPAAVGSGLSDLSTEELMFYSFSCAAFVLYFINAAGTKSFKLNFPGVRGILLGIWGVFLYHYVYYMALERSPLAEGAVLTTTWSFWIVVFSSVLVLGKISFPVLLTALTGMGGVVLVISAGKSFGFDSAFISGYLLALLCGLIWSSFSVVLGRINLKKDAMTAFTITAALISLALFLFSRPHPVPSVRSLLSAVYLGAVPLGLSFFLWNRALRGGNLVIIGFLSYLTTPLAVLIVALVHKEAVHSRVIIGMLVIIAASIGGKISLSGIKRRKRFVVPADDDM